MCEAVGEDFGFSPLLLRVPFAAAVLWSPLYAVGAYLALGLIVFASRLLFPAMKSRSEAERANPANQEVVLAKAA